MRLIMNEILMMNLGGVIVNQHYLHTLLHNVIESYYDPPKFIMSISFIMSLIITLIVFQCRVAKLRLSERSSRPMPRAGYASRAYLA